MNFGLFDAFGSATKAGPSGLILLGSKITVTGDVNVDFLNLFSKEFDNYVIYWNGVLPSGNDTLMAQLAIAGSPSASTYYSASISNFASSGNSAANLLSGTLLATGKGGSGIVNIQNVNDNANDKQIWSQAVFQDTASPRYFGTAEFTQFNNSSTVSGVRLFWNSSSTFKSGGVFRVYGVPQQ